MVAKVLADVSDGRGFIAPATTLLGRERELREITALLASDDTRIVTLLGPGGVGKTRLALALAAELDSADPGTVRYVPVAHLSTAPEMVAEIAIALGVREQPGTSVLESVAAALRGAVGLLVVDNLEQVLDAGVELAALLRACPGLTLLATSRSPLRISGERQYRVEPLPFEPGDAAGEAVAIRLFVERARLVAPFELSAANRETVHAICRRLDGLPLAIELAAARTRALSPEALLARVSQRLTLLSGGPADLPERQRALDATIAWSYDLLSDRQQRAFRLLSTIPAGFDLDLASAVLGVGDGEALALIEALLDQSLLTVGGDPRAPRFGLLQTLRDFGFQRMTEAEREQAGTRLAAFFVARSAGRNAVAEREWLAWCERERVNAAAAIERLAEGADCAGAIEVVSAFFEYWYTRGAYREGIALFERALACESGVDRLRRADALNMLSGLYDRLDDDDNTARALDRAAAIWEEAGDRAGLMKAAGNRALLDKGRGNIPAAIAGLERAIEIAIEVGDARALPQFESNLGTVYELIGDHARSAELHARAAAGHRASGNELHAAIASRRLAMAMAAMGEVDAAFIAVNQAREVLERLGSRSHLAYCLNSLGSLKALQGDLAGSESYHAQALALWEELGEPLGRAIGNLHLGQRALARGDLSVAAFRLRESLTLSRSIQNPSLIASGISEWAGLALESGQHERAARLCACAQAIVDRHGMPATEVADHRPKIRRALGKARFDAAWKAGSTMSLDDALAEIEMIDVACRGAVSPRPTAPAPEPVSAATSQDHGLTERELDVLRLVAAGKTNAEIGEALFISPFTAKTHVQNLLGKLGVESRAAASTWAAQHGLL